MPTGYTYRIGEGITFPEFVLLCAREFGALVSMRDDPMDAPIPDELVPSDYHQKHIESAKQALCELNAMSPEEADKKALEDYNNECERIKEANNKRKELGKKYAAMLKQVKAWKEPTPDHKDLKKFMVSQIEMTIKSDIKGMDEYYKMPKRLSAEEWIKKQSDSLIWDLNYHTTEDKKERERIAERNQWLKDLRESLKGCA